MKIQKHKNLKQKTTITITKKEKKTSRSLDETRHPCHGKRSEDGDGTNLMLIANKKIIFL